MGRGSEQTFLQREHADGQPAHDNMFNIAGYSRNANQNYNEISPRTSQNGYHQKKIHKEQIDKMDSSKLKIYALPKTQLTEQKDKSETGGRSLQIMYLIKTLYLEYI